MKNKTSILRGIAIAMAASLCLTGSALALAGCGGSQAEPAAQSSQAGENGQSSPAASLTGKEATDILLGKQIQGAVKVPAKVTLTAVGYDRRDPLQRRRHLFGSRHRQRRFERKNHICSGRKRLAENQHEHL